MFKKATKKESRLRMALAGPSGSGKSYTSLKVATSMGGRIALIDTEKGSASKYADIFDFDVCELESFHPQVYIDTIKDAEKAGYDILIIDSLSHAWFGKDGALELVERASRASKSGNSYVAWANVTPLQHKLIDSLIGSKCHIIATLRTKTEYSQEKNDQGKTVIRKVGLAPIQRDGVEYEFDLVGDMDLENVMVVSKTRCPALAGAIIEKPGEELAEVLMDWLHGEPRQQQPTTPAPKEPNESAIISEAMHKKIEALIGEEKLDRQLFKNFLAEKFKLPADFHLNQLPFDRGGYLIEKWVNAVAAFNIWLKDQQKDVPISPIEALRDKLAEEEIDERLFAHFLVSNGLIEEVDEKALLDNLDENKAKDILGDFALWKEGALKYGEEWMQHEQQQKEEEIG
jgi:hypothetical protein